MLEVEAHTWATGRVGWMTADLLALPVVHFLTHCIASIDQLETLVLLVETSPRWFDAATTSRQVGLSPDRARSALDALAAHNLLDIRIGSDIRYQFRPGTPDLEQSARAVAEVYRREPALVIEVVSPDFFRLRRILRRRDG